MVLLAACSQQASGGPDGSTTESATPPGQSSMQSPGSSDPSEAVTDAPTPSAGGTESSMAGSSDSPAPEGGFGVSGTVRFKDSDGYEYVIAVTWQASAPVIDVGSNPPGKTGIVIDAQPISGTFTNMTVGGRSMPASLVPTLPLVALYPRSSPVCSTKVPNVVMGDQGDGLPDPDSLGGDPGGPVYSAGYCGVKLVHAIGQSPAGGPFSADATLPNDQSIPYTFDDLLDSVTVSASPTWNGLDETKAPAFIAALPKPVAFGLDSKLIEPTTPYCTYPNVVSGDTEYVAILDDGSAPSIPGCAGTEGK